jgi:hypothetical protein
MVGIIIGCADGLAEGWADGDKIGTIEGWDEGCFVGCREGITVGTLYGCFDGNDEGIAKGCRVGDCEGRCEGLPVGFDVGAGFTTKTIPELLPATPTFVEYIFKVDNGNMVCAKFVASFHFSPLLLVTEIAPEALAIYAISELSIETV